MKILLRLALATTAALALTGAAYAKETITMWDFLGGGDGVRFKSLIAEFNKQHADKIEVQETTLEWGTPFYSKLQTSAAVGQGPDVATYHLSRIELGVQQGTLTEITDADLALGGLKWTDYAPAAVEQAMVGGKHYAVPFDVHSIVLYYNADMLKKAGMIGADGKPTGLDGIKNFDAAIAKFSSNGAPGLAVGTADAGIDWFIFSSLLSQEDGQLLSDGKILGGSNFDKALTAETEMANWVKQGWAPKQAEYPAAVAMFTSGKSPFYISGNWEVPTFVDLKAQGQLFNWGAIQLPTLYVHAATWADSHSFIIPDNKGSTVSPEKHAAVMEVIAWLNKHSLAWASAGHTPAYLPVNTSAEFKAMEPNASYASLLKTAVYDPKSVISGPGAPLGDARGNFIAPAINGQLDPKTAMTQFQENLQSFIK